MLQRSVRAIALLWLSAAPLYALAAAGPPATIAPPLLSDGHPDFSGYWLPAGGLGVCSYRVVPASKRKHCPSYNAKFEQMRKALDARQGYTDPTWQCAQAGVPRVGPPTRIVQRPGEVVLLYADSGTAIGWLARYIATDGRPISTLDDPSPFGSSSAHWDGDTLVIDSQNFVTSTWMGDDVLIHSAELKVQETLRWVDGTLRYQATAIDPAALTKPWVKPVVTLKRAGANVPWFTPPPCEVRGANDPDAILQQRWIKSGRPPEAGE